MRSRSLLPVLIAVTISVSSWLSGCGGAGGNGSSSDSSSGAGGSVVSVKNDECPGEEVALKLGDSKMISATTDGAGDDYVSCSGLQAADVVYSVTLSDSGILKAKATSAGGDLNPALYLQSGCGDKSSTTKCADASTGKFEILSLEAAAGTYYLIVDGGGASKGAFDLSLSLSTPMCGDHVLSTGEACDPPGPGCDATCQFQAAAPEQDKCPALGNVFTVPAAGLTIPDHYTTGFNDDYNPTNCISKGTGGPDRVYQLVTDVGVNGMMTVKSGYEMDGTTPTCDQDPESAGCFDRVLYVRSACGDDTSELACTSHGAAEIITFPVVESTQYYVFVDGGSATSFGTYTLFVTVQ